MPLPLLAAIFNFLLPGAGYLLFTKKKLFGAAIAVAAVLFAVELAPGRALPPTMILAGWFVWALASAVDGFNEASAPVGPRPLVAKEGDVLVHPPDSKVSTEELLREVDEYFSAGAVVAPGDTVIDVGANVGAFSLRVAERCHGDLRLLCFEPAPDTFRALTANIERNEILKRTRHSARQGGLSSSAFAGKELSFYNFRNFPTNSTFELAAKRREFEIFFEDRARRVRASIPILGVPISWAIAALPKGKIGWFVSRQIMGFEEVKAKIETLDEVLTRENIERVDLLKIDVEGPELEVLRGLGPSTWPRVKQVVMETHNRDGRQDEIEKLLKTNGLSAIQIVAQKTIDNGLESVVIVAGRPAEPSKAPAA
jgi:FkbM family methyltransferase